MFWLKWVGLPWALGADPRDGKAACCFRTAQATREELGMPWPADRMDGWYRLAQAGCWASLRSDWRALTEEIKKPEAGALLRLDDPRSDAFGIGVLADADTVVTMQHHGRLIAAPRRVLRSLPLYQVR